MLEWRSLGSVSVRRPRGEAGQTLAEFALILLVLMLLVLGIVDLGRAVYCQSVVAHAAREGARWGAVHPDADGMESRVREKAVGLADDLLVVTPSVGAERVQVEVSYTFQPVTLMITQAIDGGGGGIVLRSRSSMRREPTE